MGSSPLTRGKHPTRRRLPLGKGLIPAHAGKTLGQHHTYRLERAHPRSRGENCTPGTSVPITQGSSPLTRGKPDRSSEGVKPQRLIPAHAGKTVLGCAGVRCARAHPRSRGENLVDKPNVVAGLGSSPLTRGKLSGELVNARAAGLIPAHAGKTNWNLRSSRASRAHPRSRGENSVREAPARFAAGSSPLTRGKHDRVRPGEGRAGLIPAHAGKTQTVG